MKRIFLSFIMVFSYILLIQDLGAVLIKYADDKDKDGIIRTVTIKSISSENTFSKNKKDEIEKQYRLKNQNAFFAKSVDYSKDIVQLYNFKKEEFCGGTIVFFSIDDSENLNDVKLITKNINKDLGKLPMFSPTDFSAQCLTVGFHGKCVTEQFIETLENEIEEDNEKEYDKYESSPLMLKVLQAKDAESYGLKDYFE